MDAKVDVVAVLDAAASRIENVSMSGRESPQAVALRLARAAVGELLATAGARYIRSVGHSSWPCPNASGSLKGGELCESCAQWARFRAALVACGAQP